VKGDQPELWQKLIQCAISPVVVQPAIANALFIATGFE
jgi:hypothetical protein